MDNHIIYKSDGNMSSGDVPTGDTSITNVEFPHLPANTFILKTLWESRDYKTSSKSSDPEATLDISLKQPRQIELIETCLRRAKQYIQNNDPMQASEKLYKATEDSIKLLSEYYVLDEVQEAKAEGQWWNKLLDRASNSLASKTKKQFIDDAWGKAYRAHVFGFHENSYTTDDVKIVLPYVEKLVKYVQEVDSARRKANP